MRSIAAKKAFLIVASLSSTLLLGGCGFKSIALGLLSEFLNGGSSSTIGSLLSQATGST